MNRKSKVFFQFKRVTAELLLQNGGADTVISQYEPVEHVPIVELGVVLPKHRAYVVELMQANRPSKLHVPHVGAQS